MAIYTHHYNLMSFSFSATLYENDPQANPKWKSAFWSLLECLKEFLKVKNEV